MYPRSAADCHFLAGCPVSAVLLHTLGTVPVVQENGDRMRGDRESCTPSWFPGVDMPALLQVKCGVCGAFFRTRVRGNTTRCPRRSGGCGAPRHIPAIGAVWEGPDDSASGLARHPSLARTLVPLWCSGCGRAWETAAAAGNGVACPGCSRKVWVPVHAREAGYVPKARPVGKRERLARSDVRPVRPLFAPAPTQEWDDPAPVDLDEDDQDDDEGPDLDALRATALPALRDVMRAVIAPQTPAPALAPARRTTGQPVRPAQRSTSARSGSGRSPAVPARSEAEPRKFRKLSPGEPLPYRPAASRSAPECRHRCGRGSTFVLAGPGYSDGAPMCREHAAQDCLSPDMRVWHVTSW